MKKNNKKLAALAITTAVGLTAILPINVFAASPFTDSQPAALYQTAIEALVQQNVLSGYDNREFKPNQPITRAEVAKIVALALHADLTAKPAVTFTDVKSADWFHSYVTALAGSGAMKGENGQFSPSKSVTKEQLSEIIASVLKVNKESVTKLPGYTSASSSQLSRAEAALLIHEAQQLTAIQATSIRALNAITVQVTFSAAISNEDLELDKASLNFVFDNGLTISNVPRLKTGSTSTYIIPTPTQKAGTTYSLTYKGKSAGTFTAGTEKIAIQSARQVASDLFEIESKQEDGAVDYGYVIAAYSTSRPGAFALDENNSYQGKNYQILSSMRLRQVQLTPEGGQPLTATYLPFTQATDGRQAPKFILPNGETFKSGVTYKVSADWATFANPTFTTKEFASLGIDSAAAVSDKTITVTLTQDPKDELFVNRRVTLTAKDGTVLTAQYTYSSRKGATGTFDLINDGKLVTGTTYTVAPVGNWATASKTITLTK